MDGTTVLTSWYKVDRMAGKRNVRGVANARELGASSAGTAYTTEEATDDPALAQAIEAYKNGDETVLLPFQPTPSIDPSRPRTLAMGYDPQKYVLRVKFREGAVYEYYNVPPRVWKNAVRWKSVGRGINRVLNNYEYSRMDLS